MAEFEPAAFCRFRGGLMLKIDWGTGIRWREDLPVSSVGGGRGGRAHTVAHGPVPGGAVAARAEEVADDVGADSHGVAVVGAEGALVDVCGAQGFGRQVNGPPEGLAVRSAAAETEARQKHRKHHRSPTVLLNMLRLKTKGMGG